MSFVYLPACSHLENLIWSPSSVWVSSVYVKSQNDNAAQKKKNIKNKEVHYSVYFFMSAQHQAKPQLSIYRKKKISTREYNWNNPKELRPSNYISLDILTIKQCLPWGNMRLTIWHTDLILRCTRMRGFWWNMALLSTSVTHEYKLCISVDNLVVFINNCNYAS